MPAHPDHVDEVSALIVDYGFALRGLAPATPSLLSRAVVSNGLLQRIDALCTTHPEIREPVGELMAQWRR